MTKLNDKPNSSIFGASAGFIADVNEIDFMDDVNEDLLRDASILAEGMFEILCQITQDHVVLGGEIDFKDVTEMDIESEIKNDANLENYIKIINGLFKVANRGEIGMIKHLTPDLVRDLSITTAARASCVGGNELLKVLCDIVNEELFHKAPANSLSGAKVFVSPLFS